MQPRQFLYLLCMRRNVSAYWWCQVSGWLFYGLTMLFFSFLFDQKLNNDFYARLGIYIFSGFLFTHVLRELFIALKIQPPIEKKKWWLLVAVVLSICVLYSLVNSVIVEWLKLYNNPANKYSLEKRALYNFLGDSPIMFIWVSIYFVWHYVQVSRKSEFDKVRLESLVKELELKTIKSHINPHFIFNALNSIRALVDENPGRARTAITELSNILRSSMQADKVEMAPFERELNIVKDYLALEYIRFEERLKVEYDIDEDTLDQPVPPMMLQTLVENAIKHGISKKVDGGLIRIISRFHDDCHELLVQNTGKLSDNANPDGFGIVSTQNRLNLLYGIHASFNLRELSNGMVEAKVSIPLHFHLG